MLRPHLPRKAAGGGPRPEEGVVEGASRKLSGMTGLYPTRRVGLAPPHHPLCGGRSPSRHRSAMGEVR